MSDELKTVNKIIEKSKDIVFDRETEIRDLIRVVEHSTLCTVKSDETPGELPGKYSAWFRTQKESDECFEAIKNGKTVRVALKDIGNRQSVTKYHIITPNKEIGESSLKEQTKEVESLGGDY